MLDYIAPDTSIAGGIIVRLLTFIVSYALVGFLFNAIGWFNSNAMKVIYFIISALVGFALSYVVMILEKYLLVIGIVLGIIILVCIMVIIIVFINNKKSENKG